MHELAIIGAGPAGLTAGLYAGRYRLNTLLFEKMAAGGQIILSSTIENFPGFPAGISTQELIGLFKKQVEELRIPIIEDEVLAISTSVKDKIPIFNINSADKSYQARTVIIACGARPRPLGAKGEDRLTGRGVSYCGTCDGPLFKDKDIVVIGGGDRATEEAIFLARYARTVYLVHRRQELRASKILAEKARQTPKIKFIFESVVEEVIGENKVEQVLLRNVSTNLTNKISCQGVFVFVGIKPNTDFLKNLLEMDENGFIITDQAMQTSCFGVYACGDCRKKSLYQVITACGEGATAAHSAHQYLIKQNI